MTKNTNKKPTYIREIKIHYKKKRVKSGTPIGKSITDAKQVAKLFQDLQNEAKEKLIVLSLDSQLKILCFEIVAMGSVSTMSILPWDVVRSSILVAARGIIIIHNHPSGNSKPSPEDKKFTKELKKLTDIGGCILHDHIIIGDDEYFSFSDKNLIL